jgi:hypothetical protein
MIDKQETVLLESDALHCKATLERTGTSKEPEKLQEAVAFPSTELSL